MRKKNHFDFSFTWNARVTRFFAILEGVGQKLLGLLYVYPCIYIYIFIDNRSRVSPFKCGVLDSYEDIWLPFIHLHRKSLCVLYFILSPYLSHSVSFASNVIYTDWLGLIGRSIISCSFVLNSESTSALSHPFSRVIIYTTIRRTVLKQVLWGSGEWSKNYGKRWRGFH